MTPNDKYIVEILKQFTMHPRWLKLSAAAKYAGMNPKRLKKLADTGDIVGYRDSDTVRQDWIFDKESIDAYRLKPVQQFSVNNMKLLDDIERVI